LEGIRSSSEGLRVVQAAVVPHVVGQRLTESVLLKESRAFKSVELADSFKYGVP